MAKERKYRFYEKPHTKTGKFASLMALISILLFAVSIIISVAMRGNGGKVLGAFGIIAILVSIYGFIVGMRSFSEKEVSNLYSIIGAIGCGVMSVIWLTIFLTGI